MHKNINYVLVSAINSRIKIQLQPRNTCIHEVIVRMLCTWLKLQCMICQHHIRMEENNLFNDALNTFYLVIWRQTYGKGYSAREETNCCHYMSYTFLLAARVLLHTPSHRKDSTYHSLCYTSHEALVGMRNSLTGPPGGINPITHCTPIGHSTTDTS